jgi:predicted XRE-type DNA-binding protein
MESRHKQRLKESAAMKREIMKLLRRRYRQAEIARMIGITRQRVSQIVLEKSQ